MRKAIVLCAVFTAMILLLIGCASESDIPTVPGDDYAKGSLIPHDDNFMATIGDATSSKYYVYTPPGYSSSGSYPVLYLLNGFGRDENYFVGIFDVTDAANQLIAEGEMDPMVIVMPSGHNALGGGFYTNGLHPAVGNSEQHILDIISEVEGTYAIDATKRAIGGHSMGGFGALSIAMNNAGMFTAVSSMSGPISFWGTMPASDQYKGIEELLPAVLLETGFVPGTDGAAEYAAKMYPSPDRRVTSMIFAMAAAFSPMAYDGTGAPQPVETTIGALPDGTPMGVDLPIGLDGQIFMPTWLRWMAYDLVARFVGGQAANLAGVKIYLDTGLEDDLGLYGAQQVFSGALQQAGMAPDNDSYYGSVDDFFGDIPAGHTQQIYERAKKLLVWHSDQF